MRLCRALYAKAEVEEDWARLKVGAMVDFEDVRMSRGRAVKARQEAMMAESVCGFCQWPSDLVESQEQTN